MNNPTNSIVLGAGPMGRAIAQNLADKGQSVSVVSRDGRHIGSGIDAIQANLADAEQTVAACVGADAIYFCAAPPYHLWPTAFMPLQEAALEAASRTGAVLVAVENLYSYGVAGTLTEDLPLIAETRKGKVRAQMSKALLDAHSSGRAKCVAGRATDFFGAGVTMSALGERFWPKVLNGKTVDWVGDPDAKHSFAYLPDLAESYVRLAQDSSAWGRAWHLPALEPMSAADIVNHINGQYGSVSTIRTTPSWVLKAVGLFLPAAGELVEMRYMFDEPFIIDHSAFDQRFGVIRRSWADAISETVAWWLAPGKKVA